MSGTNPRQRPLSLHDRPVGRRRRPLIIGHRGGVVEQGIPEDSLAAIERAGDRGYDMVELDIWEAADHEPVLFHCWTGTLRINCGVDEPIYAISSEELRRIQYLRSDQHVATLEEGLKLCRTHNLGVMLDIKLPNPGQSVAMSGPSVAFLERIGTLLEQHELTHATCAGIAPQYLPFLRTHLPDGTLTLLVEAELDPIQAGMAVSLEETYWFGVPGDLPDDKARALQQRGIFVIAAINTFQYPAHAHEDIAREDIERLMAAGVDAFQVDSVYEEYVLAARPVHE